MTYPYICRVTLRADWAGTSLSLGDKLENEGNLTEALAWYEFAARSAPEAPTALLKLGSLHLKRGELAAAEAAYRAARKLQPGSLEACVNLGAVLHRRQCLPEAAACYEEALAAHPDQPDLLHNFGVALYELGDWTRAAAVLERGIEIGLSDVLVHYHLGISLHRLGRLDGAVRHCRRAAEIDPGFAPANLALGNVLADCGEGGEAIAWLEQAIAIEPRLLQAHIALGRALLMQDRIAEAAASYRRALAIGPDDAQAHYQLGVAVEKGGDRQEAARLYQRALALKPDFAEAHYALARQAQDRGEFAAAVARLERAIAIHPNFAAAYAALGAALDLQARAAEATARYRKAIELDPHQPDAHVGIAIMALRQGDFAAGWPEYEWRWRTDSFAPQVRPFVQRRWDGRELDGEPILLHAEQGLGDTIQFVRYAPLVAARGGRIVLEVQPELHRLACGMPGVAAVVRRGDTLPDFAWHCPLMSLPLALETDAATIPAEIPYLAPPAGEAAAWARRVAGNGRRVGLVWAGRPDHRRDRERSIEPALLARLAGIAGIRFFSLQRERGAPPPELQAVDLAPFLGDFADTAAAIAALDLVIAVDTSVAHLAGALGKPVWILLPRIPDWRWPVGRDGSPWYPSARLFRQSAAGGWAPVLDRVARALQSL